MFEFNATFIIAMFSFVVFIMIMNAILYKPVLKVINERQTYIDDNLNAAQNSKTKAKSILDDKECRLNEASAKSKQIVSSRVLEENEKAKCLTESAKAESLQSINSAKKALQNEEIQTAEALVPNIKALAENISAKILGETTSTENVDYDYINKVLK